MSAILSADDLNDFISPGVACIKPVETLPSSASPATKSLEHEVILDGVGNAMSNSSSDKPAQISLTDCLACSGCVTSAEAVLVSLQSHTELCSILDSTPALKITREKLSSPVNSVVSGAQNNYRVHGLEQPASKILIASVAPQVIASLAAVLEITSTQAAHKLTRFLTSTLANTGDKKNSSSFTYVVSTEAANDLSLHLSALEALSPSAPASAAKQEVMDEARLPMTAGKSRVVKGAQKKPLLASACPGWVCYAEKTHPYVLPHLSKVKSPQALTGVLLKSVLSKRLDISPERIWHCAIMPCFDKKLEAAREELTSLSWMMKDTTQNQGVRDVDCVITSKEIFLLAEERGINFLDNVSTAPAPTALDPFPDEKISNFLGLTESLSSLGKRRWREHPRTAGSSGGILHHILYRAAAQIPGSRIETTKGRNVDVIEYAVVSGTGEIMFKAARYYGFRNIQNLVRRLKPARKSRLPGAKTERIVRKSGKEVVSKPTTAGNSGSVNGREYEYVEVMACPGGCTNGGGQVKVDDQVVIERHRFGKKPGIDEQKAWLSIVDEAYYSADEKPRLEQPKDHVAGELIDGISLVDTQEVLDYWANSVGVELDRLVHTSYREVVSDIGKEVSETERVVQLAGKIGGGW